MPLIVCPDCSQGISDAAPTCPRCGRPMRGAPPAMPSPGTSSPGKTQLVEATSKKFKAWQLGGGAAVLLGLAVAATGASSRIDVIGLLGMLVMFGGIVVTAGASILAWWHHG